MYIYIDRHMYIYIRVGRFWNCCCGADKNVDPANELCE